MSAKKLEIRLLGELEVVLDGRAVALPASKKTRALLGYLVATDRPHLRERLCELLWDMPDDPRASLRWSLTKIRPLLDGPRGKPQRLVADRERVAFEGDGADVDLVAARADVAGGVASAGIAALKRASARFRGELLEGLDLPGCYRFHEWCIGERETARALRLSILSALVDRLRDRPEEALRHARERVALDPLSEVAHAEVMRLLGEMGRTREARKQYETCKRILEGELGARPTHELERALLALGQPGTSARAAETPEQGALPAVVLPDRSTVPLVGRAEQKRAIAEAVEAAARGEGGAMLLFVGEPGIGKSRLLEEVGTGMRAAGGRQLVGRAFEAEMVRPYGAWIDALRSAPLDDLDASLRADLAPLLPELAAVPPGAADRGRLFDAVARLLVERASQGGLALLLDDVHWFDEASAALLHYVARALVDRPGGKRVLLAGGARPGELADNAPALRLVRGLDREGRLRQIPIGPLGAAEVTALVGSIIGTGVGAGIGTGTGTGTGAVASRADGGAVFVESEGNPLFALELARARSSATAGGGALPGTLDGLIGDRLERLDERARELVPWAAALGRSFDPDLLARVGVMAPAEMVGAIAELERRGVLRASGEGAAIGYDFTHDLLRRAAYRRLSEPRRRLVHLQIARALLGVDDPAGLLAGDVAHHAAMGGDHEMAARACAGAGERCNRVFAYAEATALADLGLQHLSRLPHGSLPALRMALLNVKVHAGSGRAQPVQLKAELSRAILDAQSAGLNELVTRGFYLLSYVDYAGGDFANAEEDSLRAIESGRGGDPATQVRALASTAKCFGLMERDMARAEALLRDSHRIAETHRIPLGFDHPAALGFLRHHLGDLDGAVEQLEAAIPLGRRDNDYWQEWQCWTRLVRIELERGRPAAARTRAVEAVALASKFVEGSEVPFAAALTALCRLALAEPGAAAEMDAALLTLRALDCQVMLACLLTYLAEMDVAAARSHDARAHASEARDAAAVVNHRSHLAHACAILAQLALDGGDKKQARALLAPFAEEMGQRLALSWRAQVAVASVAQRAGLKIATASATRHREAGPAR